MTTPYAITPVDRSGPDDRRTRVVYGPPLKDTATRAELARRLAEVLVELDEANRKIYALERTAPALDRARLAERVEEESTLRLEAQDRLNKVMRVIASIARANPELRPQIEQARRDIWGTDG